MGAERESFVVRAVSSAEPERVFGVLADGARWSEWAGWAVPASRWERKGEPPPGGVGAVRALGRPPLVTREEVLEHDPPRRHVFSIVSGLPMRDHRAVVELNLTAEGGTRIEWRCKFTPVYPYTGPLLRWLSEKVVTQLATRLAAAAVDRTPHGHYG